MRLADAEALHAAGGYSGACYLAGYAVECGLKAIIARSFRVDVIPDRAFVQKVYSHDLSALLTLANLKEELERRSAASGNFQASWSFVSRWSETSRYEIIDEFASELMLTSVGSERDGIIPWLKERW